MHPAGDAGCHVRGGRDNSSGSTDRSKAPALTGWLVRSGVYGTADRCDP